MRLKGHHDVFAHSRPWHLATIKIFLQSQSGIWRLRLQHFWVFSTVTVACFYISSKSSKTCIASEDVRRASYYSNIVIYVYIYMVVDQNSFIPERPFFANKKFTFAKLSRTPCLSFAGPMLANNTSYEDSFTTCQITPENHGSLLGSLLNMQLASRNPFSGQIFFAKFTGPPPSTCTLTFARSFA